MERAVCALAVLVASMSHLHALQCGTSCACQVKWKPKYKTCVFKESELVLVFQKNEETKL